MIDQASLGRQETAVATTAAPETLSMRARWSLPLAVAGLGLLMNLVVTTTMAPTADEVGHLAYGAMILRGSPDRTRFDSKMPVSALNALPRGAAKFLETRGISSRVLATLRDIRLARVPTVLAAFCLCLLIYVYAESLYGRTAAVAAQALGVISPTLMAHGTLVTTDLYVALATLLFLYSYRRFLQRPTTATTLTAASTLALAQLTKFTAIYLYLVVPLHLVLVTSSPRNRHRQTRLLSSKQTFAFLGLHLACLLIVLNVAFLFDRTFTPLAGYQFQSTTFKALQQIPVLREIPVPVPYPYVHGFDLMRYHSETGKTFGNIVLLGEARGEQLARADGFATYYLAAYALKEPLGMQVLLLVGLFWIVRNRTHRELLLGEGVLLLTAGIIFLMLSLFNNAQIGIRHLLPVLAILPILSGAAFIAAARAPRWRLAVLGGCVSWAALSVGSYFPHMIPYFNELLVDRRFAYRYLADSNLDWGQNAWIVEAFLRDNSDVTLDPWKPIAGRVLVSANLLAGVEPPKADYWLRRTSLVPLAHVGYAHLLYDVPPARAADMQQAPPQ